MNASNVIAVKGHMVTKSSALSTGGSKLEAQFITAQNMASHYKRVINAKSAINTLPPKSLTNSQKARDRAKREMLNYSIARQSLDKSRAKSADSPRNDISMTETTDNSQKKSALNTVSSTIPKNSTKSVYRDVINRNIIVQEVHDPKPLPDQKKLMTNMLNLTSNFTKSKNTTVKTYQASPRAATTPSNMFSQDFMTADNKTLANTLLFANQNNENKAPTSDFIMSSPALKAMSKLCAGKHYDVLDNHAEKFSHPTKPNQPRIKHTSTESHLAKSSSYYQPPRRRKKNITSTADGSATSVRVESPEQEQEQVGKASRSPKNRSNRAQENDSASEAEIEAVNRTGKRSQNNSLVNNRSFLRKNSVDERTKEMNLKLEAEKEEEIKYLQFVKEVTNDVIARGISSNRVINSCFEYHVNKNKHLFDENKMKDLLNTLRKDIGIVDEGQQPQRSRSGSRRNSLDNGKTDKKYLTLQRLTNSANDSSASNRDSNHQSLVSNRRDSKASLNNSRFSENSKGIIDDYENQIAENIQAIRRNSSESLKAENNANTSFRKSSASSSNEQLNTSRKSLVEAQRKSSTDSESTVGLKKTSILKKTNFLAEQNINKENMNPDRDNNLNPESDSDDDVFMGKTMARINSASSQRSQQQSKQDPQLDSVSKRTASLNNDEDMFNDDYGDSGQEEGELRASSKQRLESDEIDSDEDDFDSMLKTRSFSNSKSKLEKAKKTKDDEVNQQNYIARATTPRPVPRKSSVTYKKEDEAEPYGSSDDEY